VKADKMFKHGSLADQPAREAAEDKAEDHSTEE
jgi:hypothetical protein